MPISFTSPSLASSIYPKLPLTATNCHQLPVTPTTFIKCTLTKFRLVQANLAHTRLPHRPRSPPPPSRLGRPSPLVVPWSRGEARLSIRFGCNGCRRHRRAAAPVSHQPVSEQEGEHRGKRERLAHV